MTVEQLIEKLVTLGPKYAGYTVDARFTWQPGGSLPDCYVDDFFTMDAGGGYLTLVCGDPS